MIYCSIRGMSVCKLSDSAERSGISLNNGQPIKSANTIKMTRIDSVFERRKRMSVFTIGESANESMYASERGIEIRGKAKTSEQNSAKIAMKKTSWIFEIFLRLLRIIFSFQLF